MPRITPSLLAATSAALLLLPASAHATWPAGGSPLGTGVGTQDTGALGTGTSVCSDLNGGLVCVYQDGTELEANRLDPATGNRLWGSAGVVVTAGSSMAAGPAHVASDGTGGTWVVWIDSGASPGVHVQRLDAGGIAQFAAGGILASSGGVDNFDGRSDLDVAVTPSGKLLIAFWDGGLRLQRVSLAGALELFSAGLLCSTDAGPLRVSLSADGEGAVLAWESLRAGEAGIPSIFATRVASNGLLPWGGEGVLVYSSATANPSITRAAWDGTSLFVCWALVDPVARPGFTDVRAQRLNSSGVLQWSAAGNAVLAAPNTPWDADPSPSTTNPQVLPSGTGGCTIVWADGRDFNRTGHFMDLYGQHLTSAGAAIWTANGAALDSTDGSPTGHHLLPMTGGFRLAFVSLGLPTLRQYNLSGTLVQSGSVSVPAAMTPPGNLQAIPDDDDGVLLAWVDSRSSATEGGNVYATHVDGFFLPFDPRLDLFSPPARSQYYVGKSMTIGWGSNLGGNVNLEIRRDGGPRTALFASTPNDGGQLWTVTGPAADAAWFFVSDAADGAPLDSIGPVTICTLLATAANVGVGDGPQDVVVADFDEDGVDDLLSADNGAGTITRLRGLGAAGVGSGGFANVSYPAGTQPRSLAVDDFDDDGILDAAVTVSTGVAVLLGGGAGGVGNGTFGTATVYPAGTNPQGVAACDFDEDGIVDLAVANSSSNNVSILLGLGAGGIGTGAFAAPANVATGTNPSQLVVGDFDENGIWDLAVTNNNAASNSVSVLLGLGAGGHGNGTFAAAVNHAVGANPRGLAATDFNLDGVTDLVACNTNGASVSVLLGLGAGGMGNGGFAGAIPQAFGTNPWDLAVADLNGDSFPDLFTVNRSADEAAILFNNGLGGPAGTMTLTAYTSTPSAAAIGDFLEDGRPDVAAACAGTDLVHVRYGGCDVLANRDVLVDAPNGGEQWAPGTEHTLAWERNPGTIAVHVELSRDGGLNWETLARNVSETSLVWTVTEPAAQHARLRVRDVVYAAVADTSDLEFAIQSVTDAPADVPNAALSPAWPNPSRGGVRFVLELPRASAGTVTVHDVAGRVVTRLLGGAIGAGRHELGWDGRDASGRRAPPGVYAVHARIGDLDVTRRVVHIN